MWPGVFSRHFVLSGQIFMYLGKFSFVHYFVMLGVFVEQR